MNDEKCWRCGAPATTDAYPYALPDQSEAACDACAAAVARDKEHRT